MPEDESSAGGQSASGTDRRNPNADYVRESDAFAPICPDFAVVQNAIKRHREGYRQPIQFAGDPFVEVSP